MKDRRKTIINFGGKGLGLPSVVFIVLLVLKITNVINIEGIGVFAPLWIYAALGVAIILIYFLVVLVLLIIQKIMNL